eukprot:2707518-Prymnesium_polylepis.1
MRAVEWHIKAMRATIDVRSIGDIGRDGDMQGTGRQGPCDVTRKRAIVVRWREHASSGNLLLVGVVLLEVVEH